MENFQGPNVFFIERLHYGYDMVDMLYTFILIMSQHINYGNYLKRAIDDLDSSREEISPFLMLQSPCIRSDRGIS